MASSGKNRSRTLHPLAVTKSGVSEALLLLLRGGSDLDSGKHDAALCMFLRVILHLIIESLAGTSPTTLAALVIMFVIIIM
ncbi:hypothetical protein E2C01_021435 [Portunus trituberculatus]|uniref:Uncharacterized protein n=1 Tax=Portunus trituberculatus TaxID=210409 RepID=A0A5B7E4G8_PORTR|nr:hypothetical protein [Portunus trituberculatus]